MWSPDQDLHESMKENCHVITSSQHGKWYGPCTPKTIPRSMARSPSESPRLSLTLFARTPRISFGKVKIGSCKIKRVVIENPLSVAQSIHLDKCPEKRGFTILNPVEHGEKVRTLEALPRCTEFTVPAMGEMDLPIVWKPEAEGSCRETIALKLGDFNRLQLVVFGNAIDTTVKTKPKMKTLLPEDIKKGQLLSQKRKMLTSDKVPTSHKVAKKVLQESNKALSKPKVSRAFDVSATPAVKSRKTEIKIKGKNEKQKFKAKVASRGVAQSRLSLIRIEPEQERNVPRHPLPYAAKNMYYDEKWMEKQERGFVQWLNYILTPPDELTTLVQPEASSIFLMEGTNGQNQPLAPTKEALCLRTYTAKRKMARLRRSACLLYQSQPVALVAKTVEGEVEKNRLSIRGDKHFHQDLGIKETVAEMLLSYNPLWLRIGLETVYGEILPLQCNNDVHGLKRFLKRRFFANPDIAKEYRHATVAEYYRPGYFKALEKFTLKKFLLLILFLDKAKLTRLIDHDPCLFTKTAQYKCSRDLLLAFSRDYLKGEGDVTKHLSFLNYTVSHVQTPLDEMDYAVKNLAVDLRDGLRITRVIELLTQNWTFTSNLRVPAISRLQKIHNVGVALNVLKDRGIFQEEKSSVDPRHIVDGHRERTLSFLWLIILHFQVNLVLNEKQIKEEIAFLRKYYRRRNLEGSSDRRVSTEGEDVYFKSEKLRLLLEWCRSICRLYGVKVDNFTVSMSDGRVLCYLIHYYHPCLLREEDICQDTTQTRNPYIAENDSINDSLESENTTSSYNLGAEARSETTSRLKQLKDNERSNHQLCREKVQELGGVPSMLKFTDMSATIPDEKVVITYISYLCARLLDLRLEGRAARTIQLAWRRYSREQRAKELKKKIEAALAIQKYYRFFTERKRQKVELQATLVIQAFFRGYQVRRNLRHRYCAAAVIQSSYRSFVAMRETQRQYKNLRQATLRMQALVRGKIARGRIIRVKAARMIQSQWRRYSARRKFLALKRCVILAQAVARRFLFRRRYERLRTASVFIQHRYKAMRLARDTRRSYARLKEVVIMLQARRRGVMARRDVRRLRAVLVIQKSIRMWQCRREFLRDKNAIIRAQSLVRRNFSRRKYKKLILAAQVIQQRWRACKMGASQRIVFFELKASAVAVQSFYRSYICRQNYLSVKRATIVIQACVRRFLVRKQIEKWTASCFVIQKYFKGYLLMKDLVKEFRVKREAVIKLQAMRKGRQARACFLRERKAIVSVQARVRGRLERKKYMKVKESACALQNRYRALKKMRCQRKAYLETQKAVVTLQASFRGYLSRQQLRKMHFAATCIQANYLRYAARARYLLLQRCVTVIHRRYRAWSMGRQVAKDYRRMRNAAVVIQKFSRGFIVRKEMKKVSEATVKIQASFRKYLAKRSFSTVKASAVLIQRRYRSFRVAHAIRENYLMKRSSVVRLQSALRAVLCARQFKRKKEAACVIQTRWRAVVISRQARTEYRQVRGSIITIQAFVRGSQARRAVKREQASVKLQACWRRTLQRRSFLTLRNASINVQSRFRMVRARRRYVSLKERVLYLQGVVRANQLCKRQAMEYSIMRGAIITLQAAVRGHRVREDVQRMKEAAIKIQSSWRRCYTRRKYLNVRRVVIVVQHRRRATIISRQTIAEYKRVRYSVIMLQSLVRGRSARRDFQETRNKVLKLQALIRGFLARFKYERMREASIVIQQHYRSYVLGSAMRAWYHIQKGACITIQANARAWIVRRRYLELKGAAQVIQTYRRTTLVARKQRREYLQFRSAAVAIQASTRGWSVRHHLRRSRAATRVQKWWKMCVQRRRYRYQRQCVVRLQSLVRMWTCRRRYQAVLEATIYIQRRNRANRLCRRERDFFFEMKGSCLLIQHCYRFYRQRRLVKKMLLSVSTLRSAALIVQRRHRANQSMKCDRQQYLSLRHAVITLQATYRGYLARALIARHRAAVVIQSHYRGYRQYYEYTKLKNAVVKTQALFRGKEARAHFRNLRSAVAVLQRKQRARFLGNKQRKLFLTQRKGATLIQACFRGYHQKMRYQRLKKVAVKVQALTRGRLARTEYTRLRAATVLIQRRERARVLGTSQRLEFLKVQNTVVLVQSWLRSKHERTRYLRLKNAVLKVQARVRGKRARSTFLKLRDAVLVLQTRERARILGKRQRSLFLQRRETAVMIQSWWRCRQERRRFLRIRGTISSVQACVRGKSQRLAYRKLRKAAIVIQRRERARTFGKSVRELFLTQKNAAVLIQSWVRRRQDRQKYLDFRAAVVKIQAFVRGYRLRRNYVEVKLAVVCIQNHYRAYIMGKEAVNRYQVMKNAIITIQSFYRGTCARRFFKRVQATITIQTYFRRCVARRRYLLLRNAVIPLQAALKMRLEQRKYEELRYFTRQMQRRSRANQECSKERSRYQALRLGAIRLQALYRGRQVRQNVRRIRSAYVIQQRYRACVKGRCIRVQFVRLRSAAMIIQSYYHGYMARRMFKKELAARIIQTCVRGHQARRRVEELRKQKAARLLRFSSAVYVNLMAIQIQRSYRKIRAITLFKAKIDRVIYLQRRWRARMERLRYLKVRHLVCVIQRTWRIRLAAKNQAASKVQALARMILARRSARRRREAIVAIQSFWRGYKARKQTNSAKIRKARQRILRATANVTEPMKLCNRTRSALDYLLKCKNLTTVLGALVNLEVATRLSFKCTEQLVFDNALSVIFKVVRNSNRSLAHIELIKHALAIFINVSRCPTTQGAITQEPNSLDTFVELACIFRQKPYIFVQASVLLTTLCGNDAIRQELLSMEKAMHKIKSVYSLTKRKHDLDMKRNSAKSRRSSLSVNGTKKTTRSLGITPLSAVTGLAEILGIVDT